MSKPPAKRRRIELTLEDKINLIKDSESFPKPSQKSLSEKFGVGKTTVSDILKRKSEYLANYENNDNLKKFRFGNKSKHDNLNDLMWDWFRQARDKAIPISGPILQSKALEFASQLDISDFKASNGWLEKFKSRHAIKAFTVSGESAGVNLETVDEYRSRIPEICADFEPCNIFNCDETGLYYRALPDKTLSAKGQSAKGVKNSKERLTIMFACSATGEKLKPLVIGKASKPRCFKNIKINKLPVTWRHNKKAWMNSKIFSEWLSDIDKQMRKQNRQILMFLDNASSHAKDLKLSNVTLKFLPANTTSHLQPLDQGIIKAFKARYRNRMMKSLVAKIDQVESVSELCKEINVLDAVHWISKSWKETRVDTISKCFVSSGFPVTTDINSHESDSDDEDDDIPLNQLAKISSVALVDRETLVEFDQNLPIEDDSDEWEKNLVETHSSVEINDNASESEDDSAEIDTSEPELTLDEITAFSKRLMKFATVKDDNFLSVAQELNSKSETAILQRCLKKKQVSVVDFFKV